MEKVIRAGKVAVLVSPGFGAGWSTWSYDGKSTKLIFHPKLVEAVENKVKDIEPILNQIFGPDHNIYTGGWDQVEIEWLPEGTPFYIHEYDGSESIKTSDNFILTA